MWRRGLVVERRSGGPGQLAQGFVRHFGVGVLAGGRVAGDLAEQDRRRQRGGEEVLSVLFRVFWGGWGVDRCLMETEERVM